MAKLTPLNIKDEEVYRLARELAERTGTSLTEVVRRSLRESLEKEKARESSSFLMEKLREISDRCASRPVVDHRSADEILGYDERGLPA